MSALSPEFYALIEEAINSPIKDLSIEITDNIVGEGFSGDVLFVELTNNKSQEKRSLVVKQQKYDATSTVQRTNDIYSNEIYFYDSIWPSLDQFYFETTNKHLNFVAKCLKTSLTGIKRIFLENLKSKGFVLSEKTQPFATDQLELIFKTFGIFHAASLAFKSKNPDQFSKWSNSTQSGWKKLFKSGLVMSNALVYAMKNAQKCFHSITEKHLIDKLEEYQVNGTEIMENLLNNETDTTVITHGDCWSNNMMFKYNDSGALQDMRLIDFQLMDCGSPIHDISYALYAGSSSEDLHRLEHFLKIYHVSLSDTLKELNLNADKIYSFDSFKAEWRKHCKFGFVLGVMVWKLKCADPSTVEFVSPTEYKPMVLLDNKMDEFTLRIRNLVLHMYDNNFF